MPFVGNGRTLGIIDLRGLDVQDLVPPAPLAKILAVSPELAGARACFLDGDHGGASALQLVSSDPDLVVVCAPEFLNHAFLVAEG